MSTSALIDLVRANTSPPPPENPVTKNRLQRGPKRLSRCRRLQQSRRKPTRRRRQQQRTRRRRRLLQRRLRRRRRHWRESPIATNGFFGCCAMPSSESRPRTARQPLTSNQSTPNHTYQSARKRMHRAISRRRS